MTKRSVDGTVQRMQVKQTAIVMNALEELPEQRTYVLFGLERGGTSPVAGVARALGLPLGTGMEGNNEDPEFQAKRLGRLRATIDERNSNHDVWGWKNPTAVGTLPVLMRQLRNPFFIVIYRDAVATALGRKKWDGETLVRRPDLALHEANANTNTNTSFALASNRPCLMVSHERATANPAGMVDDLAGFLGLPAPDQDRMDKILAYLAPGSYKPFEEFFGEDDSAGSGKAPAAPEPAAVLARADERTGNDA